MPLILYFLIGLASVLVLLFRIQRNSMSYIFYRGSIYLFCAMEMLRAPKQPNFAALSVDARAILRLMGFTVPNTGGKASRFHEHDPVDATKEMYEAIRSSFESTTDSAYASIDTLKSSGFLKISTIEHTFTRSSSSSSASSASAQDEAGSVTLKSLHLHTTDEADAPLIVYAHGGCYISGSAKGYATIMAPWLVENKFNAVIVEYPLAPEFNVEQINRFFVQFYKEQILKKLNKKPHQVVLVGDSAGGNILVSAMVTLKSEGQKMPACCVLHSPWLDLTMSSESFNRKAHDDFTLGWVFSRFLKYNNPCGKNVKDPKQYSALYMDTAGLPPMLISVGEVERFYDEIKDFAKRAQQRGVDVEVHEQMAFFNGYALLYNVLPEAKQVMNRAALFIKKRMDELK